MTQHNTEIVSPYVERVSLKSTQAHLWCKTVNLSLTHVLWFAEAKLTSNSSPIGFAASQLCDVVQCLHNFN